jgi:hypothetical protein
VVLVEYNLGTGRVYLPRTLMGRILPGRLADRHGSLGATFPLAIKHPSSVGGGVKSRLAPLRKGITP